MKFRCNLISISNLPTGLARVALLYSQATVNVPSAAKPQRWQPTIVIIAALGLLVAVLTGNPLHPKLITRVVAQPPATLVSVPAQSGSGSEPSGTGDREPLSGTSPTNHVVVKSAVVKRNRQPSWVLVGIQSAGSPRIALSAFGSPWGEAYSEPRMTTALDGQDILTRLCTARR
jgi:hypothetical protein